MKTSMLIWLVCIYAIVAYSQDSTSASKKLYINGYIKDLQTLSFDKDFKNATSDDLIHNRVNIKWKPNNAITGVVEIRSRLFWGENVKLTPGFASSLRSENEYADMQKAWIDNGTMILHTNIERLYFDYRDEKFNIRIGRQRINWGITKIWNPNDIFNTYNFLDFDFEERPGTDGARCKYILNSTSNLELAYAHIAQPNANIVAAKYGLNKWSYDIQFITGWYKTRPTIGLGLAGNIKDAGFKGEIEFFTANKDTGDHLNISLETDYMFKKGWYLNLGILYNNHGLYKPIYDWNAINLNLSPENIMPTMWNIILSTSKELNPLLSANFGVLYAPGTNLVILMPSAQYNLATNLDVNLVWQSFFTDMNNNFQAVNHLYLLRFKWSF